MAAASRTADQKRMRPSSREYNDTDDFLDLTDTSLESAEMYLSMNLSDQTSDQNTTSGQTSDQNTTSDQTSDQNTTSDQTSDQNISADFVDSGLGSEQLFMSESIPHLSSQSENHNSSYKIGFKRKKAPEENLQKKLRHGLDSTAREQDLDADDSLDDGFLAEVVSVDDVDADHMLSVLDDVCQDAELTPKKQGIHPYSSRKGKQPLIGKARFKFTPRREMDLVPQQMPREEFESVLEDLISEDELVTIPVAHLKAAAPPVKLECQGCDSLFSHLSLIECCEGHMACNECATKKTKQVLTGEKKGSVGCPKPNCNSSLPISELRKVHPVMVIELLEDKWNKETLEALEQMSDVVKCPECSLALVVDVEVKRFKCAQCSNSFCRHCMKKWQCNEHDLCISVKPWTSSYSGKIVNIPAFWEDPIPNQVYSLVDLSTTSMEFVDIVQHVQKFMKCDVKKIFRIQNHKIWEKYSVTRSHMIEELGMQLTKESRLFHGTDVNAIEAICNEGFDLRVSGKNAVAFGNGIYFARSASYSHRYAKMGQQAGVISLNPPISSGQSGNLTTYINTIQFGHLMTTTQGSVPTPQGFSTANQQVVQPIQIAPPTNQRASTSNTATPHDPFRSSTFGNGSTQAGSKNMSDLLAASAAAKALVLSKLNIQLKQFRQQAEGAHKMPASPSIGTASISSQKSVPSQHMPSHSLQPPANPGTSSVTGNISTAVVSNSESVVQNSGPSGSLIKGSASQSGMPSADGLLNWNIGGSVSNDTKVRLDAVNRLRQNEQHVLKTLILRFGIAKNENELKEALVNFRKPSSYKIPLKYGAVEKKADGTFTLTIKPGFKLTDARPCDCHRIPTQICDHLFNQPSVLTDALKRDQVLSSEKRLQFAKYFAMVLFFVMDSFPQSKVTTSSVNSIPSVTHASMVTCATGDSKTKVSWTSSITGNMSKNSASLISEQALAGSHLLGNNFSNPSQGLDVKPSGSSMQSNSTGMPNDTLTRLFTSGAKAVISATSHSQHSARKRTNLLGVSVCKCHRLPLTTCRKIKMAKIREDMRLKQTANPAFPGYGPRTNLNVQTPQIGGVQPNITASAIHLQGSNPGGLSMQLTSRIVTPAGNQSAQDTSARNQSAQEPEPMEIDNGSHKTLFDVASARASNDCFMVVARVLVGRICQGSRDMRRPAKNAIGLATHTAVDHMEFPQIFVVFDNTQCYPEYLVRYSSSV